MTLVHIPLRVGFPMRTHPRKAKKKVAWTKYSNTTITFSKACSEKIPTVIFEVGF